MTINKLKSACSENQLEVRGGDTALDPHPVSADSEAILVTLSQTNPLDPVEKPYYLLALPCQRPYHAEHTGSRPITEVKQHRASSVLGWVTAWEHGVLLAFKFFLVFFLGVITRIVIFFRLLLHHSLN